MKTFQKILFALALVSTQPAHAQTTRQPEAPPRTAVALSPEADAWCQEYVAWLFPDTQVTGAPSDVRPSQHVEVELNNCRSDVQEYWRVTVAEAIARVNESEATQ